MYGHVKKRAITNYSAAARGGLLDGGATTTHSTAGTLVLAKDVQYLDYTISDCDGSGIHCGGATLSRRYSYIYYRYYCVEFLLRRSKIVYTVNGGDNDDGIVIVRTAAAVFIIWDRLEILRIFFYYRPNRSPAVANGAKILRPRKR